VVRQYNTAGYFAGLLLQVHPDAKYRDSRHDDFEDWRSCIDPRVDQGFTKRWPRLI